MVAFWIGWAVLIVLVIGGAAAMERAAIRNRINGANGLAFLMAGLLAALSVPAGGAVTWYLRDLRTALAAMAVAAVLGGTLWALLARWLGRDAANTPAR